MLIILLTGCASSPEGIGFQREYPYTFRPYDNAPSIAQCSFDNVINLSTYVCWQE